MTPLPLLDLALLAVSFFFALNMGGSGLAPSFSVALGAGLIRHRWAVLLFGVGVVAGSLALGSFVAKTLGSGLVPAGTFDPARALCVVAAATAAMFLANLLRIPQSTSWVTVAAIVTVGGLRSEVNYDEILHRLLPAWLGLPLVSFVVTTLLVRQLYPLGRHNLRLLEWLESRRRTLAALVIAGSCYVAFAIGSNNVANVVGPLAAAGVIEVNVGFLVIAPLFGLGAALFRAPAETVGRGIVPLGLVTATIINLVTGSTLLCASWLGIPQSLVHINTAAVAAVSLVKEGSWQMMRRDVLQRMGWLWLATPVIAAGLTALLLAILAP